MGLFQVNKTYEEINEKIKKGQAVVVTAEEMIPIVKEKGDVKAAKEVDVVTTGTFAPMCSSGAFINFGPVENPIKAAEVLLNNVPAYAGLAALDIYIGATEPTVDDPLNKVHPGSFKYGGGHVIQDIVAGKPINLVAKAYGTDCYPSRSIEKTFTIDDISYAVLCNPRNAYQNYNCAINLSKRTKYTYMGVLRPEAANANYSTSGQLSPLLNDPYCLTIGLGTRIFLGGGIGYVTGPGSQHKPNPSRNGKGIPLTPSGTLMLQGDLKQMDKRWLAGISMLGYGCSLSVGVGVAIPVLNEEMASFTGVSDQDITTQILDYGTDYPSGKAKELARVSYAQLKSGFIDFKGKKIPTVPLSSYTRGVEIANILKTWIKKGDFLLTCPIDHIPFSKQ